MCWCLCEKLGNTGKVSNGLFTATPPAYFVAGGFKPSPEMAASVMNVITAGGANKNAAMNIQCHIPPQSGLIPMLSNDMMIG